MLGLGRALGETMAVHVRDRQTRTIQGPRWLRRATPSRLAPRHEFNRGPWASSNTYTLRRSSSSSALCSFPFITTLVLALSKLLRAQPRHREGERT